MAKYVMSDVHGCYEEFLNMLKLIEFSDDDELYILGDVIDRGPEPLLILDIIMESKNIHMLLGNHEHMFINYFEEYDVEIWYWNGGQTTHEKIKERGYQYEYDIYRYFRKLPYIKVIDNYILVHAGLDYCLNDDYLDIDKFIEKQTRDSCIWSRRNINNERKFNDYSVISGHTPVQSITNNKFNSILFREGVIYIDCGCVFKDVNGRLACLRLDDFKEFYV